jgi:hypothetical protein
MKGSKRGARTARTLRTVPRPQLVVFVGGRDAADAWMATALFAMLADADRARPVLAAHLPDARLLSEPMVALREAGCDASGVVIRQPNAALFASAGLVVTMGTSSRRDLLAGTPQRNREHWWVPAALGVDSRERARLARDLIRSRVAMLVNMEGWGRPDLSRDTARVTRPRRTVDVLAAL